MPLSASETKTLADMLRIAVTEEEITRYTKEMSRVFDYVGEKLAAVDTCGIRPMHLGIAEYAELRDDVVGSTLTGEELETLSGGAFDPQAGQFVTKPIFA